MVAPAGQTVEHAKPAAERMRKAVQAMRIPTGVSGPEVVTVSVGVAEIAAADVGSFARLLARADTALYEAKQSGRNRVVLNEVTAVEPV